MPFASPARRSRPLISLTPLIDVVFILLVFFMLASRFEQWFAISIPLPAAAASTQSGDSPPLLVEATALGFRFEGQNLPDAAALARAIQPLLQENPERALLIQAAPEASTQRLVDALGGLQPLNLPISIAPPIEMP